eukprot:364109-Chlamydomonas_euryale.AAC.6
MPGDETKGIPCKLAQPTCAHAYHVAALPLQAHPSWVETLSPSRYAGHMHSGEVAGTGAPAPRVHRASPAHRLDLDARYRKSDNPAFCWDACRVSLAGAGSRPLSDIHHTRRRVDHPVREGAGMNSPCVPGRRPLLSLLVLLPGQARWTVQLSTPAFLRKGTCPFSQPQTTLEQICRP